MWTCTHTVETSAAADAIFALYVDTATWPEWDAGLERMDLNGPFATGTTGSMVLLRQEPMAMRLAWVDHGRGFEDETPIPGTDAVVRVRHNLEPLSHGGTRITYVVTIDGQAADEIGPAITSDFPKTMAALAARAAMWRPSKNEDTPAH